jgi:hypothetical protein
MVKASFFRVAILFIALFITEPLQSQELQLENVPELELNSVPENQEKDSIIQKSTAFQFACGSKLKFKGKFFSGGFYYLRNNGKVSLIYDNYSYDYLELNSFKGYLNYFVSISILYGGIRKINKCEFFLNTGLKYGTGRFNDLSYKINEDIPEYLMTSVAYYKTRFAGLILNGGVNYAVKKNLSIGLLLTGNHICYFKNTTTYSDKKNKYTLTKIENFGGLQLNAEYKLRQWNKKRKM